MVAIAPRKQKAKNKVGLTLHQEEKLKARLRETAPSEPWVEFQIKSGDDTDPRGVPITYRYHSPRSFPPRADHTPMLRCPVCERIVPATTFETPLPYRQSRGRKATVFGPRCADCAPERVHEAHGASPSATAIAALQMRNLRLDTIKVESESHKDLRREILRYKQTGLIRSEKSDK